MFSIERGRDEVKGGRVARMRIGETWLNGQCSEIINKRKLLEGDSPIFLME